MQKSIQLSSNRRAFLTWCWKGYQAGRVFERPSQGDDFDPCIRKLVRGAGHGHPHSGFDIAAFQQCRIAGAEGAAKCLEVLAIINRHCEQPPSTEEETK
jgi:hypothetical protein